MSRDTYNDFDVFEFASGDFRSELSKCIIKDVQETKQYREFFKVIVYFTYFDLSMGQYEWLIKPGYMEQCDLLVNAAIKKYLMNTAYKEVNIHVVKCIDNGTAAYYDTMCCKAISIEDGMLKI